MNAQKDRFETPLKRTLRIYYVCDIILHLGIIRQKGRPADADV